MENIIIKNLHNLLKNLNIVKTHDEKTKIMFLVFLQIKFDER